jgi:hypothetical protein
MKHSIEQSGGLILHIPCEFATAALEDLSAAALIILVSDCNSINYTAIQVRSVSVFTGIKVFSLMGTRLSNI